MGGKAGNVPVKHSAQSAGLSAVAGRSFVSVTTNDTFQQQQQVGRAANTLDQNF